MGTRSPGQGEEWSMSQMGFGEKFQGRRDNSVGEPVRTNRATRISEDASGDGRLTSHGRIFRA